jgi:uncharacterized SAM-binding protein YcdF (DUF218 family)
LIIGTRATIARKPVKLLVRRRRLIGVALLSALAIAYLARAPLLTAAARILTVDTAAAGANYIVALGGGAETRPFTAAELYRKGIAPAVLVLENPSNETIATGLMPSGAGLYRRILEHEGVPASAITRVPGEASTTWDEAVLLRAMLPASEPVTLVVVTSPEHTRRAQWAFRKAFEDTRVEIRMAPSPNLYFDETNWWRNDLGVLVYLHEYFKLPFYWVRYAI